MDACVEVDIDFDDHLNPSNMRFSVFVGLVGEGASRTLGAQKLCPPVGKSQTLCCTSSQCVLSCSSVVERSPGKGMTWPRKPPGTHL